MRYILFGCLLAVALGSCDTSGVKSKKDPLTDFEGGKKPKVDSTVIDLDQNYKVVDDMTLSNGIKIKWFKHGDGEIVKNGDMIDIDYKVYLEDGQMIDANSLRNLPSVPYMVGFQMQNGWDFALREMRIGDHAEIFLPAKMARGDKAIDGLIPKNSSNIIKVHIKELHKADRTLEGGTRVWLMNENKNVTNKFGPNKRMYFHCYISSPTNPRYFNTEFENNPFNYGYDDPGLVPGFRKALNNAKKADLMLIHVPAAEAYGNQGYLDLVKPNEDLFYRVFVMEVKNK